MLNKKIYLEDEDKLTPEEARNLHLALNQIEILGSDVENAKRDKERDIARGAPEENIDFIINTQEDEIKRLLKYIEDKDFTKSPWKDYKPEVPYIWKKNMKELLQRSKRLIKEI